MQEKEHEVQEKEARLEREKRELATKLEHAARQAAEEEARRKKEAKEVARAKKEVEKQLAAEQAVTRSLTENLGVLKDEMRERERETAAVRSEVEELQEQMRGKSLCSLWCEDDADRTASTQT